LLSCKSKVEEKFREVIGKTVKFSMESKWVT